MNKWNRLLKALDHVYGFANQSQSSMKKLKQGFDEKSNEHVIVIEYRVMKGETQGQFRKRAEKDSEERKSNKLPIGELMQEIYNKIMEDRQIRAINSSDVDSTDANYHH